MPPPRRRARALVARLAALALSLRAACAASAAGSSSAKTGGERWALVADAGSTGTRVYLFRLGMGEGKVNVTDVGKGPALSSFKGAPERASEAVAKQLGRAKAIIPADVQPSVPLSVFATAGMRLMAEADQQAIYAGLRAGLLGGSSPAAYPFDGAALEARTISGREEGVFALIAANYLAKRLHTTLQTASDSLMGVLDLGGSSTQVGVPPMLAAGDSLPPKLGEEHTFVRSFLNLGMERMRERTYRRFVDNATSSERDLRAVANPCAFSGYTEAEEAWHGTGEAAMCEAAASVALAEERVSCASAAAAAQPPTECLSEDPMPIPPGPHEAAKFFLISGYMYVTDFAGWALRNRAGPKPPGLELGMPPMPTIRELRAAADAVCSESWDSLSPVALDPKRRHAFTIARKLPHRCFELCYIVALLSTGYGFQEDARLFHIVEDIDGLEIEWTLGAFLHRIASGGHGMDQDRSRSEL